MESIRELYKIGRGPSSSHTMGPEKACDYVINKYHGDSYIVKLYGSLSLTGKGHLTDQVILEKLPNCQVIFSSDDQIEHPNTMDIIVYKNDELVGNERIYSVGGGKIVVK
ncbi:MAG: L-serine ammonia-lyase, partial [Firmicutes bacterium]|nr:L-serine ammonia-lyase [Bacillota bacterium]